MTRDSPFPQPDPGPDDATAESKPSAALPPGRQPFAPFLKRPRRVKARPSSLWTHSHPMVRLTYRSHMWMYLLGAPAAALIMYAPFLAVKTYDAKAWVPVLAAIVAASHLLAIFFTGPVERSRKTSWVVGPMLISNIAFLPLLFVGRGQGALFALIIIAAQALRAPMISAQSAIFRSNYPPVGRSMALAVPMAVQFLSIAVYARLSGWVFDHSEELVVPVFLVAGALGVAGGIIFNRVETIEEPTSTVGGPTSAQSSSASPPPSVGLLQQFSVLRNNPGFLLYETSYMCFGAGFMAISATMPIYLSREFNPPHSQATMAISTIPMVATALTLPFWGRMIDRYNPLVMRAIVEGVWSLTPLVLFFAPTIHGVYAAQLIQGLVWSGSILLWWLGVNYFARKSQVATFMSIHQTLTGVRGVIMPFVGIAIADVIGYRNGMLLWFGLMQAGFLLMIYEVIKEKRKGKLKSFSEIEEVIEAAEQTAGGHMPIPNPEKTAQIVS